MALLGTFYDGSLDCTVAENEFIRKVLYSERCYVSDGGGSALVTITENSMDSSVQFNSTFFTDRDCLNFDRAGFGTTVPLDECTVIGQGSNIATFLDTVPTFFTRFTANGITCDELEAFTFEELAERKGDDLKFASEQDFPFKGEYCISGSSEFEVGGEPIGSFLFTDGQIFGYNDTSCQELRLTEEAGLNLCFQTTAIDPDDGSEVSRVIKFGGVRGGTFSSSEGELGILEIGLIVAGSIVGVILLAVLVLCVIKSRKKSNTNTVSNVEIK